MIHTWHTILPQLRHMGTRELHLLPLHDLCRSAVASNDVDVRTNWVSSRWTKTQVILAIVTYMACITQNLCEQIGRVSLYNSTKPPK